MQQNITNTNTMNILGNCLAVFSLIITQISWNITEISQINGISPKQQPKVQCYTANELRWIRSDMNKASTGYRVPAHVILRIRALKINRKKKRKGRGGVNKSLLLGNQCHQSINIEVAPSGFQDLNLNLNHLCLGLANVRSIKNKDELVLRWINRNKIDIMILTETWLNTEKDEVWLTSTDLNKGKYVLDAVNRKTRSGGSVAMIRNKTIKAKLHHQGQFENIFEYALWTIGTSKHESEFAILAVYHPPPNKKITAYQSTIYRFLP